MMLFENRPYTEEEVADIIVAKMVELGSEKCLCCAASMKSNSRTISKSLAEIVLMGAQFMKDTGSDHFTTGDLTRHFKINFTQYTNVNIVQKHGLVAHKKKIPGEDKTNGFKYVITTRGWQFIHGDIAIPKTVFAFRNKKTTQVADNVKMVTIHDLQVEPWSDPIDGLFSVPADHEAIEEARVFHKVKKSRKKVKNPCPKCGYKLTIKRDYDLTTGVAILKKEIRTCENCKYDGSLTFM